MIEARRQLPEDLESMPPGPELAVLLGSVDRRALSGKDRIRLAQARNRLASHVQAELLADLYSVTWEEPPPEEDSLARGPDASEYPWSETEIAFALRWTSIAAGWRLEQARQLIEDLPAVQEALTDGRIDMPKALLIGKHLALLEVPTAQTIAEKVLEKAPEQTTGQLRARLARLVIAADPTAAADRAKTSVTGRRVAVRLNDDQLAELAGYDLAPHRVAAGWERLNAIARASKSAGDSRSMDQLRADALLDLVVGEGIAAGEPITDGDLPEPSDPNRQPAADPIDAATPWPTAPADPGLLEPDSEPAPPVPDRPTAYEPAELAEPPASAEGDPSVDPDHEQLRPYWLSGFEQLPSRRPGCPHCSATPAAAMPGPRKGVVDLQLSLTTLMGLDDLPGELAGFGPLLADIARQLVAQRPDLQHRFSVYDDELGQLIAHGITKQRPPPPAAGRCTKRRPAAEVAAFVRARNRTCTAPGCRRPSASCDLDHTLAWNQDGESEPDNLGPACRRHHLLKHANGSDLVHLGGGSFGWQTPRGMQYVSRPDPPLYTD